MRKILLFLLLIVVQLYGWGQVQGDNSNDPAQLPKIVPPSPEVASLAKIGSLSAGLHTGSANAQVPLYELSVGGIKLPVALSYGSNGIRVSDVPSRVGLGWNLVAGGVVSRVVHDEPDGESTWLNPPANPYTNNIDFYNYMNLANAEGNDTEVDEFSYSANGISGKFFFDANGVARSTTYNNMKIEKQGQVFVITSGDGIKYYW
jgi:hypothetical protein